MRITTSVLIPALGLTLALAVDVSAAPPAREGLPPGLQKKEKLPPGWQKKVGSNGQQQDHDHDRDQGGQTTPNTSTSPKAPDAVRPTTPTTPSTPATPVPPTSPKPTPPSGGSQPAGTAPKPETTATKPLTREQKENQARFERVFADLEAQAQRDGASGRLLERLSRQQNIPVSTLQSQLRKHPGLTVPQLYVATVIAREGRTSLDPVVQSYKAGKSWAEIARDRKVSVADLADRLRAAEEVTRSAANAQERRAPN
jgi:hypothetical protein